MPRTKRGLLEGGFYHLMARGNNRQMTFYEKSDYEIFLGIVERVKTKHPFRLHHYALMPNHIHLLVQVQSPLDLSRAMQKILQTYSDHFRFRRELVGHLWQGRYKSVLLPTDKSLLLCGRYIELNPVRAALCRSPEDYAWSSYRFYVEKRDSPFFLEENPAYTSLGDSPEEKERRYREIVFGAEEDREIKEKMGLESHRGRPKIKGQSLFPPRF